MSIIIILYNLRENGDNMHIITCVDNRMGTFFNNRRQSRDANLCQKVLTLAGTNKLYMNSYSLPLFKEMEHSNIVVDEEFLKVAGKDDYCFAEGQDISLYLQNAESLIIFKWNRDYPYDKALDVNLELWHLQSAEDFAGSSHEKITMEKYVRR